MCCWCESSERSAGSRSTCCLLAWSVKAAVYGVSVSKDKQWQRGFQRLSLELDIERQKRNSSLGFRHFKGSKY